MRIGPRRSLRSGFLDFNVNNGHHNTNTRDSSERISRSTQTRPGTAAQYCPCKSCRIFQSGMADVIDILRRINITLSRRCRRESLFKIGPGIVEVRQSANHAKPPSCRAPTNHASPPPVVFEVHSSNAAPAGSGHTIPSVPGQSNACIAAGDLHAVRAAHSLLAQRCSRSLVLTCCYLHVLFGLPVSLWTTLIVNFHSSSPARSFVTVLVYSSSGFSDDVAVNNAPQNFLGRCQP